MIRVASLGVGGEYDILVFVYLKYLFCMMLDIIELVLDGEGGSSGSFAGYDDLVGCYVDVPHNFRVDF